MNDESPEVASSDLIEINPDLFDSPYLPDKAASKALWFTTVSVTDPTGAEVELSVYLHQSGGVFAIDSSFLTNGGYYEVVDPDDDDSDVILLDPFVVADETDARFKVQLSQSVDLPKPGVK